MYSNSISKNGCLVSPFLLLWSSVMVAMLVFVTESHASCPITTQAATGPEQSAIVKFIDCSQSGPSDPPSCGAVQKQVTLIKDVTTNVGYDKNGYAVTAKFTGRYTCLSWLQRSKVSSYYTTSKTEAKCKSTCFKDDIRQFYNSETYCNQQGTCTFYYQSLKAITTPGSAVGGNSKQCPIYTPGKSGNIERVRIEIWNCIRATSSTSSACGGKPIKSSILLTKDVLTNLNNDVNDYQVMAKFYGDEVCVSLRHFDYYDDKFTCKENCASIHKNQGKLTLTYKTKVRCSAISCGGGFSSYKFFLTSKAGVSAKSNSVLMVTALLVIGMLKAI